MRKERLKTNNFREETCFLFKKLIKEKERKYLLTNFVQAFFLNKIKHFQNIFEKNIKKQRKKRHKNRL